MGGDDTDSVEVGAANHELGVTNKDSLRKGDEEPGMELRVRLSGEKPFAEHLTKNDLKSGPSP